MPSPDTRLIRVKNETHELVKVMATTERRTILEELDLLVERGIRATKSIDFNEVEAAAKKAVNGQKREARKKAAQ